MAFLTEPERVLATSFSELAVCNPFLPDRVALERKILGRRYVEAGPVWHARPHLFPGNPNLAALTERAGALADTLRERLATGVDPGPDGALYEELVTYLLYHRVAPDLYELIIHQGAAGARIPFHAQLARDVRHYLELPGRPEPDPARLLAFFFQVRRAFHFTIENILGGSLAAARLRAAVWHAIFTHDMRRYRRGLYQRMHDVTTLIVGPTGTGKELVARAIGLSRYVPFEAGTGAFSEDFRGSFFALNLSALPATLIESELFGHRKGAFTGAVADRLGWLEECPLFGTVFLDEIAEIDTAIQVKLLRVLQTRSFQRLGDTRTHRFQGKIVAATNRDLAGEMQAGRFRPDLYYRLCSHVIETPALESQLRDASEELSNLLRFIAHRVAGESEAETLAGEAEAWIAKHLGRDYPWPGNVRELEQCVRNVMIQGEYRPAAGALPEQSARGELGRAFVSGTLTADEMLRRYCTLVFAATGSYVETARRLGIDRRTVKERVDPTLVERLRRDT